MQENNRSGAQRLFVALHAPDTFLPALAALTEPSMDARWTPPEQFHLTLRFLGDTAPETTAAVVKALSRIEAPSFPLTPTVLDVFPSRRNPRVLVMKVDPTPPLQALYEEVQDALVRIGMAQEQRPFTPHLTLARLKRVRPQAVRAYLRAHEAPSDAAAPVTAFHLYESILQPTGALHRTLTSFSLRAGV